MPPPPAASALMLMLLSLFAADALVPPVSEVCGVGDVTSRLARCDPSAKALPLPACRPLSPSSAEAVAETSLNAFVCCCAANMKRLCRCCQRSALVAIGFELGGFEFGFAELLKFWASDPCLPRAAPPVVGEPLCCCC